MAVILDPFLYMLALVIDIYFKIVVVEVILYWLVHFGVVKVSNKYAAKTMELLEKATLPVYKKIKEKIPTTVSGFDLSPFILMLVLLFLGRLVYRLYVAISSV